MAFFSGTDTSTLKSQGALMPHFVSLIVNNAGQYVAKITRQVTKEIKGKTNEYYTTFDNMVISLGRGKNVISTTKLIQDFDLHIQKEEVTLEVSETHRRAEELREKKKIKESKKASSFSQYGGYGYTGYGNNRYGGLSYKEPKPEAKKTTDSPFDYGRFSSDPREPSLFDDVEDFFVAPKGKETKEADEVPQSIDFDLPVEELELYASKLIWCSKLKGAQKSVDIANYIGNSTAAPMREILARSYPLPSKRDEYAETIDQLIESIMQIAYEKRDDNVEFGFGTSLLSNIYNYLDALCVDYDVYNEYVAIIMEELLTYEEISYYE